MLFSASITFARPTSEPTTQAADAALPADAVRVLGDGRLENTDNVRGVSFSTDGKWLATCRGNLDLWDLATGQHIKRFDRNLLVTRCIFLKDGSLLAMGRDRQVLPGGHGILPRAICIDPVKDEDVKELTLPAEFGAEGVLSVSPDSERAVFAGSSRMSLIDTSNGQGDRRVGFTATDTVAPANAHTGG